VRQATLTHHNHVWSYDLVMDRTHDGKPIKILTQIEESKGWIVETQNCPTSLIQRNYFMDVA